MEIRLPQQARSRDAWDRVLTVGASLIAENGLSNFTIAEVCKRANVAPRFIYDRVNDKETLFLACYEKGLEDVLAVHTELSNSTLSATAPAEEVVSFAVHEVGKSFLVGNQFLKHVVLISGTNEHIYERGAASKKALSEIFQAFLTPLHSQIAHPSAPEAVQFCFDVIFDAWVIRVAYGPTFSAEQKTDEEFSASLQDLANRYLLGASKC
jgi:AcrR family transcriptional regulator